MDGDAQRRCSRRVTSEIPSLCQMYKLHGCGATQLPVSCHVTLLTSSFLLSFSSLIMLTLHNHSSENSVAKYENNFQQQLSSMLCFPVLVCASLLPMFWDSVISFNLTQCHYEIVSTTLEQHISVVARSSSRTLLHCA
jgi:hypothetical protein